MLSCVVEGQYVDRMHSAVDSARRSGLSIPWDAGTLLAEAAGVAAVAELAGFHTYFSCCLHLPVDVVQIAQVTTGTLWRESRLEILRQATVGLALNSRISHAPTIETILRLEELITEIALIVRTS